MRYLLKKTIIMKQIFQYFIVLIFLNIFIVQNTYAQKLKQLKGAPFNKEINEIKLYKETGKTIEFKQVLKELKGSVIYLDFWASWCSPCIKEMPHSKDVQRHFKGKNIAFLYLSTDVEQEKWLKGLKRININGHHYRIDPESKVLFKNLFKIPGIPYYVILDKNGNIAEPKAKWPRDERVLEDIARTLGVN